MTRKALIIGASRGIGWGLVHHLRQEGVEVLATARQGNVCQALEELGARCLVLDVSSERAREDFLGQLAGEEFSLIVHVAGVYGPRSDAREVVSQSDFASVMNTNVAPVMHLLPRLMPRLRALDGRWVSVSSLMGSIALSQDSSGWLYKTSKAALNMAIHSAARAYAEKIIVSMSPGWVRTDMGGDGAPLSVDECVRQMLRTIESLSLNDSGRFLNLDGQALAW